MKFTIEMIDKEDCTTTKGKDIHIEEKTDKILIIQNNKILFVFKIKDNKKLELM